jgi:Janus/Ocnus family (Ocnus)
MRMFAPLCVAADIFEDVEKKVSGTGVTVWCVGGGRILHTAQKKKLNVFGYSQVRPSFCFDLILFYDRSTDI